MFTHILNIVLTFYTCFPPFHLHVMNEIVKVVNPPLVCGVQFQNMPILNYSPPQCIHVQGKQCIKLSSVQVSEVKIKQRRHS